MPGGRRFGRGEVGAAVNRALTGQLGDANLQNGALGTGRVADGERAGKAKAMYAELRPKGASGTVCILGHRLGAVPEIIEMVKSRGYSGEVRARAVEPEKWTPSSARVTVWTDGPALDGLVVTFRVSGR